MIAARSGQPARAAGVLFALRQAAKDANIVLRFRPVVGCRYDLDSRPGSPLGHFGSQSMSLRRLVDFPWVQRSIGVAAAEYLRFVWQTSEFGIDPADIYTRVRPDLPAIVAMWHGQHFMMPFFKRKEHLVKVLISRHRDGEINAVAASRLGVEPIRGSGTSGRDFLRKGGVAGFEQMLDALAPRL